MGIQSGRSRQSISFLSTIKDRITLRKRFRINAFFDRGVVGVVVGRRGGRAGRAPDHRGGGRAGRAHHPGRGLVAEEEEPEQKRDVEGGAARQHPTHRIRADRHEGGEGRGRGGAEGERGRGQGSPA